MPRKPTTNNTEEPSPLGMELEVVVTRVSPRATRDIALAVTTTLPVGRDGTHNLVDMLGSKCQMVIMPEGTPGIMGKDEKPQKKENRTKPPRVKSPSERLRAVLYVLWERTAPNAEFDVFYGEAMDKLINQQKDRIPVN